MDWSIYTTWGGSCGRLVLRILKYWRTNSSRERLQVLSNRRESLDVWLLNKGRLRGTSWYRHQLIKLALTHGRYLTWNTQVWHEGIVKSYCIWLRQMRGEARVVQAILLMRLRLNGVWVERIIIGWLLTLLESERKVANWMCLFSLVLKHLIDLPWSHNLRSFCWWFYQGILRKLLQHWLEYMREKEIVWLFIECETLDIVIGLPKLI